MKLKITFRVYLPSSFDELTGEKYQGNFVREFQATYSYSPSTLEAMGYDAARIMGEAVLRNKISSKEDIKSALLKVQNFQGVTGLKGFGSNGEAKVEPYLLSVDGNGIREIR